MRIRHGRMAKALRRGIGGTGEMNKSAIVARVAARTGMNHAYPLVTYTH